jgi:hypothetical protein
MGAVLQVAKTSHWEVMLLETARYESPILDVILVTDNADALKHVVDRMMLPLTVSYYQTQQPSDDNNKYWLTWEHRKAIEQSVAKNNYTTVVYMEVTTAVNMRIQVCGCILWQPREQQPSSDRPLPPPPIVGLISSTVLLVCAAVATYFNRRAGSVWCSENTA